MNKSYMPLEKELEIISNTPISMEFDPQKETMCQWQEKAQAKLTELLGINRIIPCDEDFNIVYKKGNKKYTEYRFLFQSEEHYYVPCHLLIPKAPVKEKPPVMICLQGHSTGMHISLGRPKFDGDKKNIRSGDRNFAVQCINRGYAALVVEQRCFGERGGAPRPVCHGPSAVALLTGRTMIGLRVWDVMRAIDCTENHFADVCDTSTFYCMGNSGGGTATFYASALESRIKAAIPSCAFCTFYDSIGARDHCDCNYVPGIRNYFDMAEIAAMSSPKPLVIVSGKEDGIFPIDGAKYEFDRLKNNYYANSDKPENCVHVIGEKGHRFYADLAWPEFEKLINK